MVIIALLLYILPVMAGEGPDKKYWPKDHYESATQTWPSEVDHYYKRDSKHWPANHWGPTSLEYPVDHVWKKISKYWPPGHHWNDFTSTWVDGDHDHKKHSKHWPADHIYTQQIHNLPD